MKIFYITTDFKLSLKPDWLDDFRQKYDDPYEYHITLKQATYFDENKTQELETLLASISSQFPTLELVFDAPAFAKTENGHVIMIMAAPNAQIISLQKLIRDRFSAFGEIIKPYYKEFEDNFHPHITIARHLSNEAFEEAKKELKEPIRCRAILDKLVLNISDATKDANLLKTNKTEYRLN